MIFTPFSHQLWSNYGKLLPLRILGQLAASYIVAEGPDDLYLIDQDAAHERILFEGLAAQEENIASQALLEPMTLELTPEEAALEEWADKLSELGWKIEPFGGRTYVVRATPTVLAEGDVEEALREILSADGDYQQLLKDWEIQVSMNGVGAWYDNAPMESFFGTLKSECVNLHAYRTREDARADLFYYIEVFYESSSTAFGTGLLQLGRV